MTRAGGPVRRSGISGRGDVGDPGTPDRASELGWDDSLYERGAERRASVPGQRPAPDAEGHGDGRGDDGGGNDGAGQGRSGRGGRASRRQRRKPKPRWRRVLVWTAASLALLVAGVAVAGYLYLEHLNGNLTKKPRSAGSGDLEKPPPNAAGQSPLNILLLGTDSREGEENQRLGGARDLAGGPIRADVQMLLHASADRSNITVISIPRDTQVPIPECTDPDTGEVYPAVGSDSINNAHTRGGPGCVLATWEELTGIYIDHFMSVDFAGVVDIADAVGGVPVCVEENVHDPKSGLRLEAGETIIQGEQALQWLRTRRGFEGGSDINRTRAQQMYLSNMVEELQASATLTNTGELMDLAEAATNALTVNNEIGSVQALYDLATDLRQVPNDRINMVTLPWLPDPANPDVTVIPDPTASAELFEMVRTDVPLDDQDAEPSEPSSEESTNAPQPSPPAEVAVSVRNATGSEIQAPADGRASELTNELLRLGYAQATTDTASVETAPTTEVRYAEEADRVDAEALAEALGIPRDRVMASPATEGVALVIGDDWREGTAFPETPDEPDETATEDEPAIAEDDIISGAGGEDCMAVDPNYTW
ncbi:LCP family protein [Streptomyces triticirhizae]|uniref:LytR family transcriptional regulator n=1 Tax=Streptomyces triticirhizae TaxID=2483353 RepID=A0A3M2LII7_9ACTN|nr:LCP family protein [Streptomyces triticirhizae]RMI37289.1 LytR family transcriptional regulator [Streptomyces triticirhizae]